MSLLEEQLEEIRKKTAAVGVTPEMADAAAVSDSLLGLKKPQHWTEKALEEDGKMKFFGKMLLGGFTGLTPLLFPEMIGSKARYASELDIYEDQLEHAREQAMRQKYVDVLMNPESSHRERMAAGVMAGGLSTVDPNPITASAGTAVLDPITNNVIHNQPQKPEAQTAPVKTARETARMLGIPTEPGQPGSEFYPRLIAAYGEPVQEIMDEQGNVQQINTIQQVLSEWDAFQQAGTQGVDQEQPAAPETSPANPVGLKTQGPITTGLNEKQAQLVTDAPEKLRFYDTFEKELMQAIDVDPNTGEITVKEDFLDLYGSLDGNPLNPTNWAFSSGPEGNQKKEYIFKSGAERDMNSLSNRLVNMLTVDERGKLKGQGQITEGETKMLRDAVSYLEDRGISDEMVERHIRALYEALQKSKQEQINMIERHWDGNSEYYNSRGTSPNTSSNRTPTPVGNKPIVIDLDAN